MFVPARRFDGARPNFVFTTRDRGTGYYFDGEPSAATKRPRIEEVGSDDDASVEEVNADSAKRLLLQLEKRMLRNRQLRVKHAEDPMKFVDSEVDLDEAIQELSSLSSSPSSAYDSIVECGGASSLVSLLSHENGDIRASACALMYDLTDLSSGEDEEDAESMLRLCRALVEADLVESLVANVEQFDESNAEESQATHDILGVFEHLFDLDGAWAEEAWTRSPSLTTWLANRVQRKGFDANKLYASEILAISLQLSERKNAKSLGEESLDIMLRAANYYRARSPSDLDEQECLANIFDAIYAALSAAPTVNVPLFVKAEGLELMLRCAREGRHAAPCAVKVVDAALASLPPEHGRYDAATRFIEVAGLKVLFAAIAGKGAARPPKLSDKDGETAKRKAKRAKRHAEDQRQTDEQILGIAASLCFYATPTAPNDALPRLVAKLAQVEKIDALVDKISTYSRDVRNQRLEESQTTDGDEVQVAASHARVLRVGGHALRLASVALSFALVNSPSSRDILSGRVSYAQLAQLLVEYADELDERDSHEDDEDARAVDEVAKLRSERLRDWAAALSCL